VSPITSGPLGQDCLRFPSGCCLGMVKDLGQGQQLNVGHGKSYGIAAIPQGRTALGLRLLQPSAVVPVGVGLFPACGAAAERWSGCTLSMPPSAAGHWVCSLSWIGDSEHQVSVMFTIRHSVYNLVGILFTTWQCD
jgi:hypothetical protein